MAIKAERRIQLGIETVKGTEVGATVIYRGTGVPKDDRVITRPDEDIGLSAPTDRSYTSQLASSFQFEDAPMTFQQAPYIFACGIENIVTGVADAGVAASGLIYQYDFPTTTARIIKSATLEGGDNQQEEQSLYNFVKSFNISGNPGEALMIGANWMGRTLAPGTFTAALAIPTVEEILFNKGSVYIDASSGTVGTTNKSNTLVGMNFQCDTGWDAVQTADGENYFSFEKFTRENMNLSLDLTFEHDGTSVAEKAAWRAETVRLLQLKFLGSALTTAGSAYTYFTFIMNFAGKWGSFDALTDNNGNDIVKGTFLPGYNSTDALFAQLIVVNQTAAL